MSTSETFFIVTFRDPAKLADKETIALKVRSVEDSELGLGFVRISNFIFESTTGGLIVDHVADQLKHRFANTHSLHISLYNILSIEEVGMEHRGLNFKNAKSNIYMIPQPPEV